MPTYYNVMKNDNKDISIDILCLLTNSFAMQSSTLSLNTTVKYKMLRNLNCKVFVKRKLITLMK